MIIGICGKSGSGKSTLAQEIIKRYNNAIHLDIDKIGHKVLILKEVKEELVAAFGPSILNETIDRKLLGKIVFSSTEAMEKLTEITWKYMQAEIDSIIQKDNKTIILDWILLPKTKYFDMCDVKILLDIPYEVRKKRAVERDNISEEAFDLRDKSSIDYNLSLFDYVLQNNEKELVQRLVRAL